MNHLRHVSVDDTVNHLIGRVVDIEIERGVEIDFIGELVRRHGDREYTAREVVNAIGHVLTLAGVSNNLEKDASLR